MTLNESVFSVCVCVWVAVSAHMYIYLMYFEPSVTNVYVYQHRIRGIGEEKKIEKKTKV